MLDQHDELDLCSARSLKQSTSRHVTPLEHHYSDSGQIIIEDPTVTVKCRTTTKSLFLCLNLCLGVMLDCLSC